MFALTKSKSFRITADVDPASAWTIASDPVIPYGGGTVQEGYGTAVAVSPSGKFNAVGAPGVAPFGGGVAVNYFGDALYSFITANNGTLEAPS